MPIEAVPNSELKYYLVSFDAAGNERTNDPDGQMSQRIVDALQQEPYTDVFLMSHGWMGDVPAARAQYGKWIGAMAGHSADLQRMNQLRPGFRPLLVGVHWPSLPFGDEELGGSAVTFSAPSMAGEDDGFTPDLLVEQYAARLAGTPAAVAALQTIVAAALDDVAPSKMPADVRAAYDVLDREAALGSDGAAGAPGSDREPFDAEASYRAAEDEMVSFGGFSLGGLLAPLRMLSFWKMKDRARQIGGSSVLPLLNALQRSVANRDVRFHLMGHSFGCIVMSSTLAGPGGRGGLLRPVASVALVQGALSIWSFAAEISHAAGKPGYFHQVVADKRVAGPIITTQSEYDKAVGRWYPLAAGVRGQFHYAPGELPKYGALGTFGVRGPGTDVIDREMLPADQPYGFQPGKIYNLESSHVIREGTGPDGAHSDFSRPKVAHAVWEAAMTGLE